MLRHRETEEVSESLSFIKKKKKRESSFIKAAQFHCAAERKTEERKVDVEVKQTWTAGNCLRKCVGQSDGTVLSMTRAEHTGL